MHLRRALPLLLGIALLGTGCTAPPVPIANTNTAPAINDAPQLFPVVTDARACTDGQVTANIGEVIPPVTATYAHLKTLGALLTAGDCGTQRVYDLFGGEDAMFIASSRVTLAADATPAARTALTDIGYACETSAVTPCRFYILRRPVPVSELMKLRAIAAQIQVEDCISCRPPAK